MEDNEGATQTEETKTRKYRNTDKNNKCCKLMKKKNDQGEWNEYTLMKDEGHRW